MALQHVRSVTQQEMLLAIAMSQYFEKTHVLFIPPNTHYTGMLEQVKRKKLIKSISPSYYGLTEKGILKVRMAYKDKAVEKDKKIEEFIDKL